MQGLSKAEVERTRSYLLVGVFTVLTGFAVLVVLASFLGPDYIRPLQSTPIAARVGILLLTIGLVALVWEKEQALRRLSLQTERQNLLLAAFRNRLHAVETLLEASGNTGSTLGIEGVLKIVADAAVDLIGARNGGVRLHADENFGVALAQSHSTDPAGRSGVRLNVPLVTPDGLIGTLSLTLARERGIDESLLEALEWFAGQAAAALDRARVLSAERASVTHLQASNVIRSRFLATVSHELRTPLTAILGYSATLDHHWPRLPDAEKKDFLKVIEEQANRLSRLVERVLEAARLELEGLSIHPVVHDVRESVKGALRFFRASKPRRIKLALPAEPIGAEVDPFVVDQVVINLVDNALRYTRDAVEVSARAEDGTVVVEVSDRGPGMSQEQIDALDDPSARLHEDVRSGPGLGLHIVRTLVRDHGGRLEVTSAESGTRVAVRLPRAPGQSLTADQSPRKVTSR